MDIILAVLILINLCIIFTLLISIIRKIVNLVATIKEFRELENNNEVEEEIISVIFVRECVETNEKTTLTIELNKTDMSTLCDFIGIVETLDEDKAI